MSARIGWEATLGLGVEVGYRTFTANIDDLRDANVESDFSGPFAGVSYHF